MRRKPKRYLSALRMLLATAACAGLGLVTARATVVGPFQLPGHGSVVSGSSAGVTSIISGSRDTFQLSAGGRTAINWNASGGTINTTQPGGFNIGHSATVNITASCLAALLNVDVSGSPTQIFGHLMNTTSNVLIFVANANGITVGPSATITAPAGLALIAASVITAQLLSNPLLYSNTIPVSFASSGPLNVQGNLQGVNGFVLLAGSGALNVSPIQSATGITFGTNNVSIIGGVGGSFVNFYPPESYAPTRYVITDAAGSVTPSASSSTTVTLNLGTSANPYNMLRLEVLANGNIVNNGVLGGIYNAVGPGNGYGTPYNQPILQWTGTLMNNGTINAELNSLGTDGKVSFQGNTLAQLAYGGLVNNGTIAIASSSVLTIQLPGTIINNHGATISNVGGSVALLAGNAALPLFTGVGGAVVNHGSIIAQDNVALVASNPNHVGPYAGGGALSDGSIQILSANAHTNSSLNVASLTGNAFLGGTVTTPHDAAGLANVYFESGSEPVSLFTLGINITAASASFTGGSLTGSGTLTTANVSLADFTGNVNNVTSQTNYLANGFHVANGPFGSTNVTISLPTDTQGAVGTQKVNVKVAGNAAINSGATSTFVGGLGSAGILPTEANAGSSLLVQASGNLTVNPSMVGPANYALSSVALGTRGFVFPGRVVLIAGSTVTLGTVVDNGYAPTVGAGQGIFFQAPTISVPSGSSVITNGDAWVNFSTAPTSAPAIYGLTPALMVSPIAYTTVANSLAYHIRSY